MFGLHGALKKSVSGTGDWHGGLDQSNGIDGVEADGPLNASSRGMTVGSIFLFNAGLAGVQ